MKPMLAATITDLSTLKFPVFVSPKLDGIRCLMVDGSAMSRNLKPIPNNYVRKSLKGLPNGLDGELMLHGDTDFNDVQSAVMSEEGEPNFYYAVFDFISMDSYRHRFPDISNKLLNSQHPIKIVPARVCNSIEHLLKLEEDFIEDGYEGIMIRSFNSPYKYGRSTLKEGYLIKYKRFKDTEAEIIGFEELFHNENEQILDALGRKRRATCKKNLVEANTLGAIIVYDKKLKATFKIGTGFNESQRANIWKNRNRYHGKIVTYKYQDISSKGIPRFPVFKAFRIT